jgi:hypothetical protein
MGKNLNAPEDTTLWLKKWVKWLNVIMKQFIPNLIYKVNMDPMKIWKSSCYESRQSFSKVHMEN